MAGSPVAQAGSYFGGAAMKDALLSGFAAAARILGEASAPVPGLSAPPRPEVRA